MKNGNPRAGHRNGFGLFFEADKAVRWKERRRDGRVRKVNRYVIYSRSCLIGKGSKGELSCSLRNETRTQLKLKVFQRGPSSAGAMQRVRRRL